MRSFSFIFLCMIWGYAMDAQEVQDTLPDPLPKLDTFDVEIEIEPKQERLPRRAALYSLIFPGGGQFYNGRWWKTPIVYGALGTTIYLVDYNRDFYQSLQQAYVDRLDGRKDEYDGIISTADGIRSARDQFRKDMELAYFATAGVYLLQVLEAYIDAHLQGFDVDEVLSYKFTPYYRDPQDPAIFKVGLFVQLH